jgi:hypothetical protein
VNTRKVLQERGIALIEFVPMMERTRALVYSLLSESIVNQIGDNPARRIEEVLGLKPLSLDTPTIFRVTKALPGSKLDRSLSKQAELEP